MIAILYCPSADQIYEWDGWDLKTRIYTDIGGYKDETGSKYRLSTISVYGGYKDYGLVRIGHLD